MTIETGVWTMIRTLWGEFPACLHPRGIQGLLFPSGGKMVPAAVIVPLPALPADIRPLAQRLRQELDAYFASRLTEFDLPLLLPSVAPPFHLRIWQELQKVPFGKTITYGELTKRADSPRGARAAGQACGANPIPILIPCHRILSATGPGGFSSGLDWKFRLLKLEAR